VNKELKKWERRVDKSTICAAPTARHPIYRERAVGAPVGLAHPARFEMKFFGFSSRFYDSNDCFTGNPVIELMSVRMNVAKGQQSRPIS
jgi:hypothetical protein